jgi:hypothetical protein
MVYSDFNGLVNSVYIGYLFSKRCFDKLELQLLLRNVCTCLLNWVNISGYVHMRSIFLNKT